MTVSVTVLPSYNYYVGSLSYIRMPYKKAGWTERQAAAHLISRFTFGTSPGEVDEVVKYGLDNWMNDQLDGKLPDGNIEKMLSGNEALIMSNAQILQSYPKGTQVVKMATEEGVLNKDSVRTINQNTALIIKDYMLKKGFKPQNDLLKQLINQKILRAAYSNNQLHEVMTDFWFNHFNVSSSKGGIIQFMISYERDAIRPNVLGRFENLLLATAKSPAMLIYLDNSKSTAPQDSAMLKQQVSNINESQSMGNNVKKVVPKAKQLNQGINENYAREIMELHTLGVDGGYTQSDVTQTARILTGWGLNPQIASLTRNVAKEKQFENLGYVVEKDFFFSSKKHDTGSKNVLGESFPAGGGYEEGVRLIHILASHQSTAQFICKKLAVRFVNDNPKKSLVDKMAKTFLNKDGSIKEVLITMISSPEFWSRDAFRAKTKSPFELAVSSIRTTAAEVHEPYSLYLWINKMGQQLYNYQAPTGFPDKGRYWINTGSLLNRMNFGLAFAAGRIFGVKLDLLALNKGYEPESSEAALKAYSKILLPERNLEETIKRLTPMLNNPELDKKIGAAADKIIIARPMSQNTEILPSDTVVNSAVSRSPKSNPQRNNNDQKVLRAGHAIMLSQVAGIIIGSPEFQRR